ncbi:DNA-directed RNA polymerase sigma-70 factor [Actinomadura sp. NBRC 104425]|uniref:RNA polymerase sigma factor n=1 Tax=Actinomadura sp. NBRC 104425 TaxID=3032204 RepID=UPI0024A14C14|nr:RNA polymerase sigma factor [Actinomadura sp. NBRC 104425]GLZ16437.1 DNA-directed RNA polymerase sigma-70 factor [Actinomadura sp. NBRC 104425]
MTQSVDAPPSGGDSPGAARHDPDADDSSAIAASLHDPDQFTVLYDRHAEAVYRYVAGRLGAQAADDVAAETFLVAFRRRERFDATRGSVRSWLFGIATRLVAQHRRAETRRYRALARVGAEREAAGHEDRVVTWVTAEGMQPRLASALAALSAKERDVVLLAALSRLGHEEIAAALGIPYGTVGSRLNRARRKLRAALGDTLDQEGL